MNKKEAKSKIKELDEQISVLRDSWMTSVGAKKNKLLSIINKMLDERIDLMKIRDTKVSK